MKFSDTDLSQLQSLGIQTETAEEQIENFKKGFPFLKLIKPATIGDGILKLDESQIAFSLNTFLCLQVFA